MKAAIIISIFIGFVLSIAVAGAISLTACNLLSLPFHPYLWLLTIVSYASLIWINYIVSSLIRMRASVIARQVEQTIADITVRNDIECVSCKELNSVQIDVKGTTMFNCAHCNAKNKVLIGLQSVVPTDPATDLDMQKLMQQGIVQTDD